MLIYITQIMEPVFPGDQVELTSRIYENKEFQCRLYLTFKEFSCFLINEVNNTEENELALGIATDRFVYGPIACYGLFRELLHPLDYDSRSGVFTETSRMELKSSFFPGPKGYILLRLIPGHITLFYQTRTAFPVVLHKDQLPDMWTGEHTGITQRIMENRLPGTGDTSPGRSIPEDVPLYYGVHGLFSLGTIFTTEILLSRAEPEKKDPGEEWFFSGYKFPGGNVYHVSMKNTFSLEHFTTSLSGSISCGDIILPGYFLHTYVSGEIGWCSLSLMFGYSSPWYVTPDGSYTPGWIRTGPSFLASPVPWCTMKMWYDLAINHPGRDHTYFLAATQKGGGNIILKCGLKDDSFLEFSMEEQCTITYNEDGEKNRTHRIDISGEYTAKHIQADTGIFVYIEKDNNVIPEWKTGMTWKTGIHSFIFHNKLRKDDTLFWEGKLEYRMKKEHLDMWLSCACKKPVELTEQGYADVTDNPFRFLTFSAGFKLVRQ